MMMKRPTDRPLSARLWPVRLSAFVALSLWLFCATIQAQEPQPKAPAATEQSKAASPVANSEIAAATSPLTAFGRQIPAMRPNRGIWIPSFVNGVRNSLVEADVVTRIDDNRLEAENMTINLYGAEAKEDVEITLPSATYHMTHQILRSDERSKVSRADFDLEGDSLIFDTMTSQGRMTGNVRMTIHDARGFMDSMNNPTSGETKGDKAAAAPPSTEPAPPATSTATSSSRKSAANPTPAQKP